MKEIMELQLVNFEQAKSLKELGFPQDLAPTIYQCSERDGEIMECTQALLSDYGYISCPTLELAAKFFRDEKNISLEPYRTGAGWICMIVDIPSGTDMHQVGYNDNAGDDKSSGQFTTFEKALSAGIDKAMEILKNNE